MFWLVMMALLGGVCLGLNRVLIARLGMGKGHSASSFYNHLGGTLLMCLVLLLSWDSSGVHQLLSAPPLYFIGGVIGAFFVALTSWIIPYLGIMKTTVLLISGQMLMGTAIDFYAGNTDHLGSALLGLFLIIMGTLLGARAKTV